MSDWLNNYKSKRVSPERAAEFVTSGANVYFGGNAATPFALLRALAARAPGLRDVRTFHLLVPGNNPLDEPEVARHFQQNVLFIGPADREAVNEGRADYVPISLHRIPDLFDGHVALDVAMVQATPPDAHGFMSLGVEVLASKGATRHAERVIVQVNERMPRTLGDTFLHVHDVHAIVEETADLPEIGPTPSGETAAKIGKQVAVLVEDGATLQLGIGEIPDAVLAALGSKHDLGMHTEMVSDGAMQAIERGIMTGARKNRLTGKVVATFALGSRNFYEYLDNNPMFEFRPVEYTNDPFIIGQNDRLTAINSALEVDLTGQVCADSIGSRIYSGFGGQLDFIRGAAHSKGGKPIIALPSTARNGTVSRIVAILSPGAGVVTTRADVHYVVTEFGVADLFGRNLRERARALIDIAHPRFRPELEEAARALRRLL